MGRSNMKKSENAGYFRKKCIRSNSEYIFSETHGSALNAETGTII